MNQKEHLPLYGVGPVYVAVIMVCTIVGIGLSVGGVFPYLSWDTMRFLLLIVGCLFVLFGIYLWICANFQSKLDSSIRNNMLITTGVYAYVRNPIYSAFMLVCTGVLLIYGNAVLFVLPFLYWGFLTVLMKNTEEKWLMDLYGKEYREYCKRVNRCIPWFGKK